jgi:serine/threonine-protein kinase RsbW
MQARLTLRADAESLGRVEGFVTAFAAEHGIHGDDASRVLIVLEELLTNFQKYGHPGDARPGVAAIGLSLEGTRLTIEFTDDGAPFDPFAEAAPDLNSPVDERAVGGLGIHILRALTDEARYVRSEAGNVVRLMRRVSLLERR